MTQLLKKDVSPKHVTPNPADSHRPDSVYRPNPFPINPVVGYPSAPVTTYHYPPPHVDSNYDDNVPPPQYSSYDTTSSYPHSYTYGQPSHGYDTSTVTYPPHAHHSDSARYSNSHDDDTNNNSYHTGNHNSHNHHYNYSNDDNDNDDNDDNNDNEDESDDDNDDTDPETTGKKNSSDVVPEKLKLKKPSRKRLAFRFIQLLASIGALGFIAGASSVSHVSTPHDVRPGVIGLYVVSIISCLVSLFYVCKYFSRRFGRNRKLRRWIMLLIDFLLAFAWGILGYFLIVKFKCPPGGHNGWCNFYNTSIFFNTLAFVTFAVSIFWDMYGGCRRGH